MLFSEVSKYEEETSNKTLTMKGLALFEDVLPPNVSRVKVSQRVEKGTNYYYDRHFSAGNLPTDVFRKLPIEIEKERKRTYERLRKRRYRSLLSNRQAEYDRTNARRKKQRESQSSEDTAILRLTQKKNRQENMKDIHDTYLLNKYLCYLSSESFKKPFDQHKKLDGEYKVVTRVDKFEIRTHVHAFLKNPEKNDNAVGIARIEGDRGNRMVCFEDDNE